MIWHIEEGAALNAEMRAELRRRLPNATWIDGWPCPIGTRVRIIGAAKALGVVEGVWPPVETVPEPKHREDCPTCSCSSVSPPALEDRPWIVRQEVDVPPSRDPYKTVNYPWTLEPVAITERAGYKVAILTQTTRLRDAEEAVRASTETIRMLANVGGGHVFDFDECTHPLAAAWRTAYHLRCPLCAAESPAYGSAPQWSPSR